MGVWPGAARLKPCPPKTVYEIAYRQELEASSLLCGEIHSGFLGNDSCFVAHVEQAAYRFSSIGAVVEGALVHVHADEFVGELGVEVAGELHGVGQGFFAVIEGVLNALA